jgi:hypothetical protein
MVLSFSGLAELEPALVAFEEEARAVHDDGVAVFFCSNFVWLPMYTRLKTIIGVHRPPPPGGKREGVLFESATFEVAYVHLSRLLPPCRNCGCRLFDPIREGQLA